MYDEMFFASTEELNDPIDMQTKFIFPDASKELWERILFKLWNDRKYANIGSFYFLEICPISYEKIILNFRYHSKKLLERFVSDQSLDYKTIQYLLLLLKKLEDFFDLYMPRSGYSVSFSKTCDDMLMWSHYAKSHTGFCIIFRPINNAIYQCSMRKKDSIAVTEGHNTSIGESFPIQDINYNNDLNEIDAFLLFPVPYTGHHFENEEERLKYHKSAQKQLLTKTKAWDYEKECRLLLSQPYKWIAGKGSLNSHQRLFHYDFTQVVGVIFGHRMSSNDKKAIKNILIEKLQRRFESLSNSSKEHFVFDFLFQQAEISPSSRSIIIKDLELFSMGTIFEPGTDYHHKQINKWCHGEGIRFKSGQLSHEPIA